MIEEGIYFDMPESEYHKEEALSTSRMKIIRISPFHYWWGSSMNPACPEQKDDTDAKIWGKAFHKIMLEPDVFHNSYIREFTAEDYPDALKTVDDMKAYCVANEIITKGCKKRDDFVMLLRGEEKPVQILDDLKTDYIKAHPDKVFLSVAEIDKLETMARMGKLSPNVKTALEGTVSEVSIFVKDPDTGIMLKCRMDAIKPNATLDLKTFTNSRGLPIKEAIREAIKSYYYNLQYVVYDFIRQVATEKVLKGEIIIPDDKKHLFVNPEPGFAFIFTESEQPHYTRIIDMQAVQEKDADANIYYQQAWDGFRKYVNLYHECFQKYGVGPWLPEDDYEVLQDSAIPNILYQTY